MTAFLPVATAALYRLSVFWEQAAEFCGPGVSDPAGEELNWYRRFAFRFLAFGAILRIILATGCIEGPDVEERPTADALDQVTEVTATLAQDPALSQVAASRVDWSELAGVRRPLEPAVRAVAKGEWPTDSVRVADVLSDDTWDYVRASVLSLYRANGYMPLFVGSAEGLEHGARLLSWLAQATELGLDPRESGVMRVLSLSSGHCRVSAPLEETALDQHVERWSGTMVPSAFGVVCEESWVPEGSELEIDARLAAGFFAAWRWLSVGDGEFMWRGPSEAIAVLESVLPDNERLWTRVAALRRYAGRFVSGSDWPVVESSPRLKQGSVGPRVEQVKRWLVEEGYLEEMPQGRAGRVFDSRMAAAVRAYREAAGLPIKPVVDEPMLANLRMVPDDYVMWLWRSIRITVESGNEWEPNHVLVNIPHATVWWVEQGAQARAYRGVVGFPYESRGGRTPVMASWLTSMDINPIWTPSDGILKRELLPAERRKPGYLEGLGFTRRDERWIQLPGPDNVLGPLRLDFENERNLYIHGSPDRKAFSFADRALSHGCVRVDDIVDLAGRVAGSAGIAAEPSVSDLVRNQLEYRVTFEQPVALYIIYDRVNVLKTGKVIILPDPYKQQSPPDRKELAPVLSLLDAARQSAQRTRSKDDGL